MGEASIIRATCLTSAGIAQLVERNLAKVEVASSSLVSRSKMASWQSGDANDCKSLLGRFDSGARLHFLSLMLFLGMYQTIHIINALVVELVDTADLKSAGR